MRYIVVQRHWQSERIRTSTPRAAARAARRLTRWISVPTANRDPAGAASISWMMNSVDPFRSARSTTSWQHSGCTMTFMPGSFSRIHATCSGRKSLCTLQWPAHRMMSASCSWLVVSPPPGLRGCQSAHCAVRPGSAAASTSVTKPRDLAVLRPRCWSGRNSSLTRSPDSSGRSPPRRAQSKTRCALLLVQQAPPCWPTNALIAAELLT